MRLSDNRRPFQETEVASPAPFALSQPVGAAQARKCDQKPSAVSKLGCNRGNRRFPKMVALCEVEWDNGDEGQLSWDADLQAQVQSTEWFSLRAARLAELPVPELAAFASNRISPQSRRLMLPLRPMIR